MRRRLACASGQATVELVALLPVLAGAGLLLAQLLAAGAASGLADHAARAGAVALLEHRDPVLAARAAAPGVAPGRLRVEVHGRQVRVALRPRALVPALAARLEARGQADAGPVAP